MDLQALEDSFATFAGHDGTVLIEELSEHIYKTVSVLRDTSAVCAAISKYVCEFDCDENHHLGLESFARLAYALKAGSVMDLPEVDIFEVARIICEDRKVALEALFAVLSVDGLTTVGAVCEVLREAVGIEDASVYDEVSRAVGHCENDPNKAIGVEEFCHLLGVLRAGQLGQLPSVDLLELMNEIEGRKGDIDRVFAALDFDQDGLISIAEFCLMVQDAVGGELEGTVYKKMSAAFKGLSLNQMIDVHEFRRIADALSTGSICGLPALDVVEMVQHIIDLS